MVYIHNSMYKYPDLDQQHLHFLIKYPLLILQNYHHSNVEDAFSHQWLNDYHYYMNKRILHDIVY